MHRPPDAQPETPARDAFDPEQIAALLESLTQEDEPGFEVVVVLRQVQRRIEPQLLVRELGALLLLVHSSDEYLVNRIGELGPAYGLTLLGPSPL